jgi:hypothetical protein
MQIFRMIRNSLLPYDAAVAAIPRSQL